jgi:hypothetical protein
VLVDEDIFMAVTIKEYIVLYSSGETLNLDEVNKKAAEGWELVNVSSLRGVRQQVVSAYVMQRSAGQSETDTLVGVFTASASDNRISLSSHGLGNGALVRFATGTEPANALPTPLAEGIYYYVVGARGNDFQVSLIDGGNPVDITDAGVGGTNEVWRK